MYYTDMSRPSILLVDDKPANLLALGKALEGLDCDIVKAGSGQDALFECLNRKFACILMDVKMPDMDGFETAQIIKNSKEQANFPIVFITAHDESNENFKKGYDLGAIDYITKPLNIKEIVVKVKMYCELFKRRNASELAGQLHQVNMALKEANRKLSLKNTEILDVFYTIAHELMTPVGLINTFSSALSDRLSSSSDSETKESLEYIMDSCQQLYVYVTDLLDASRLEKQKIILRKANFSSGVLIKRVLDRFKGKCAEKNIALVSNLADENIKVSLDEGRFYQIMTNLINNALKFTERGGIEIGSRSSADSKFISFYVNDTGCGISKEHLKSVFNPFYQASDQPAGHLGGLGLGLSVVKGLVNLHGGEVFVESKLGEGSSFSFTMPIATR